VGFQDFLGNTATVTHLRESVRSGRFPHSLILAGPRGAGKYTLALMLAQAVNCLNPPESDGLPDFCGVCSNCIRIAAAANLDALVDEAVSARDDMRDTDKRETRILIQTHPDVLVVPPDPPQLLIKLGQVRQAIHAAYYRPPVEAERRRLKDFLYENLYYSPALAAEKEDAERITVELFAHWMEEPDDLPRSYREKAAQEPLPRVICDYIAGMTDPFIYEQYEKYCGA